MAQPKKVLRPVRLIRGDALAELKKLADASIDALVTDPPAGIGFMGKEWDDYRRSRNRNDAGRDDPFGRTSAKGSEYGRAKMGFLGVLTPIFAECLRVLKPGAHGVVWAIPRTSHWTATALEDAGFEVRDVVTHHFGTGFPKSKNVGNGFGTALKPASEHWILVRKPLGEPTVAANVLKHGVGAINIDGCRIGIGLGGGRDGEATAQKRYTTEGATNFAATPGPRGGAANGRWPANLVLSHADGCAAECAPGCPVAEMDRQSPDTGGASRFFYCAKASRSERNIGLTDNSHPTVKAVALMRWLCRLVAPLKGIVLDPFMGSGSTGIAARMEGFGFIGIEREAEYVALARARLNGKNGKVRAARRSKFETQLAAVDKLTAELADEKRKFLELVHGA